MTEPGTSAWRFSPRTVWTQSLQTPLRRFLRTETGSAVVLLAATLAALAWANIDPAGYAGTWGTMLVIRSGTRGPVDSWQGWVNSGLMALFSWWPAWKRAASSTWASCVSGGGWHCR